MESSWGRGGREKGRKLKITMYNFSAVNFIPFKICDYYESLLSHSGEARFIIVHMQIPQMNTAVLVEYAIAGDRKQMLMY